MMLRPLMPGEEPQVRSLLADAGLPVEDLDQSAVRFIVATDQDALIGAVGLETFDGVGLLRSLVVHADARSQGLGGQLVDALEAHARNAGLRQLVLLTQTAEPFFARRGYRRIDRQTAPAAVQASAEFHSICPASATCMTRLLDQTPQ